MKKIVTRQRTHFWKSATRFKTGNKLPLLSRRLGIETEFSVISDEETIDSTVLFSRVIQVLSELVPLGKNKRNPYRYFMANGGAISLEFGGISSGQNALFELATPECTSPLDAVIYQAATRDLLSDSLSKSGGKFRLTQANHDGHGHFYGQHESYEMEIASGISLLFWRSFLIFLFPILLVYKIFALVWITLFTSLVSIFAAAGWDDPLQSVRMASFFAGGLRMMQWPLVAALSLAIRLLALHKYRRRLSSFLASRCIVDGSGYVDELGVEHVSVRASRINCLIGFGSYSSDRPMFRCDPLLKQLFVDGVLNWTGYQSLFSKLQRIELTIGDSGLCPKSQLVRIGATSLVLDLIERTPDVFLPTLADPVDAIQRFSRDPSLDYAAAAKDGGEWTAMDLQDSYACSVLQFLQSTKKVPGEAWQIVHAWQNTLNVLRCFSNEGQTPAAAIGGIDWVTKKWIRDQNSTQSIQNDIVIDLKYHQISPEGYGLKTLSEFPSASIFPTKRQYLSRFVPPSKSPGAIRRGYLIREFSGARDFSVGWKEAEWRSGHRSKFVKTYLR